MKAVKVLFQWKLTFKLSPWQNKQTKKDFLQSLSSHVARFWFDVSLGCVWLEKPRLHACNPAVSWVCESEYSDFRLVQVDQKAGKCPEKGFLRGGRIPEKAHKGNQLQNLSSMILWLAAQVVHFSET